MTSVLQAIVQFLLDFLEKAATLFLAYETGKQKEQLNEANQQLSDIEAVNAARTKLNDPVERQRLRDEYRG